MKKCIGKKDYDYPKSKGDFNHLVNVLKSWENFQKQQLNFDTNINCIIIKSGIKLWTKKKDVDLLEEELFMSVKELFMSKKEYGVYKQYLDMDLRKIFRIEFNISL